MIFWAEQLEMDLRNRMRPLFSRLEQPFLVFWRAPSFESIFRVKGCEARVIFWAEQLEMDLRNRMRSLFSRLEQPFLVFWRAPSFDLEFYLEDDLVGQNEVDFRDH